jgi:hypothetical protein
MLSMNMPKSLKLVPEKPNSSEAELVTGKIYETNCFKDGVFFVDEFARNHPLKKMAAKMDLDNTCVTYGHTFGTDHWFDDTFAKFRAQGYSIEDTKKLLLQLYLEIVRSIHPDDVLLVEQDTPEVINGLQARGVDVLALTSRGSFILEETKAHLAKHGINFNKGTYANKKKVLPQSEEGLFIECLILTGGKHKGQCMMTALEDFGNLPDFIIMWDDKLENLERVRASIAAYNEKKKALSPDFTPVQFVGIRYSKLDHKIQNVDRRVVDIQEKYFRKILSDKHALAIHKADLKEGHKHYIGIDYQPQSDRVVLAVHKPQNLKYLLQIDQQLDSREIKGAVRTVRDKEKVARQFVYTINDFAGLYLLLKDAQVIEPGQVAAFDVIFSPIIPVLTPLRLVQETDLQAALLPPGEQLEKLALGERKAPGM